MLIRHSRIVILGLYALDTINTGKSVNRTSQNNNCNEVSLGGPPTFAGFISKVLTHLYPTFGQSNIYSYICTKGQSLLKNHPANSNESKQLIKVKKCPKFTLEYSQSKKERKLTLDNPPTEFDCSPFHWEYENPPLLNISSIYHEFNNPEIFAFLRSKGSYIAFDPQGCFRIRKPDGKISYSEWFSPQIISKIDCIKLSENEAYFLGFGQDLFQIIISLFSYNLQHVIITQGSNGALLGVKKGTDVIQIYSVPAYTKGKVRNETGAGDVFLFSFLAYLKLFRDELDAAAFATSLSSLLIEFGFEIDKYDPKEIKLRQEAVLSGIKEQIYRDQ